MDMLLIFKLYLLYGLAFFAIFFAILFRNLKKSRIAIASALPTLALFGLIHGFHEWSELYLVLYEYDFPLTRDLHIFIVFKLWVSYIALGAFAWKMLDLTRWRHTRILKGGTLASLLCSCSACFIATVKMSLLLISTTLRTRYVGYSA